MQSIIEGAGCRTALWETVIQCGIKKPFVVMGRRYDITALPNAVLFSGFTPNPDYLDIQKGLTRFREAGCDGLVAVGGGSAMDTAKAILLFMAEPGQSLPPIPLIAVPTTAGTGSESTRYTVFYRDGEKQSVAHEGLIPSVAILDGELLESLPLYQKKCTFLDALCQAIESLWSVNSTPESTAYAQEAIRILVMHGEQYVSKPFHIDVAGAIMHGANLAGQAINITQTTAAHAMCYKLTTRHQLPHGHAVAVCLAPLWRHMLTHMNACADPRGQAHLKTAFNQIAQALGYANPPDAIAFFEALLARWEIRAPLFSGEDEIQYLAGSVNAQRLGNTPVILNHQSIAEIYRQIGGLGL